MSTFPVDLLKSTVMSARTQGMEPYMSLWQDFLTNDGKIIHKWVHYFPIYEGGLNGSLQHHLL